MANGNCKYFVVFIIEKREKISCMFSGILDKLNFSREIITATFVC